LTKENRIGDKLWNYLVEGEAYDKGEPPPKRPKEKALIRQQKKEDDGVIDNP